MLLSSCSSSLTSGSDSDCDDLQAVAQTFIDAAILHDQDPSVENCKSYRSATEAYLDLIQDCSLTSTITAEEAQQTLDDLDC